MVAQIMHKYFPVSHFPGLLSGQEHDFFTQLPRLQADVQLHSFSNGTSTATKLDNWQQLRKICSNKSVAMPEKLLKGTIKVHIAQLAT